MSEINCWLSELESAQNVPQVASAGALFQTKAKYRNLKEQIEQKSKTIEEIQTNGS